MLTLAADAGEMPGYFREALSRFIPEVPPGWAYTLTTTRNASEQISERYDPSRPNDAQWTLLLHNGQPPSAEEIKKYSKAKAGGTPSAPQATFQRDDIASGGAELVREGTESAEFLCSFREEASGSDKMLGHLRLRVTVAKGHPHVEKFSLELRQPYSPVLFVKMHELLVETTFSPPASDRPALPAISTSHFAGRIFFIRVEESLKATYTDYAPAG